MTSNLQNSLIYAHQTNIARYHRLLKTVLTDHEREFIERRLGEEKDALVEIARKAVQFDCFDAA